MRDTRKASLAFGSVVTEEHVAMLAAPFAEAAMILCISRWMNISETSSESIL